MIEQRWKHLAQEDERYLIAAEGWLGLGDHLSANEELEQISADWRAHFQVLIVRLNIYWMAKKWEACIEIANAIVRATPDILYGWIGRSYALHELKRTQEAWDSLVRVTKKFPKEPIIPYNLSCYACQLGKLETALSWLDKAFAVGDAPQVKLMALADPDLKPLWHRIAKLEL